MNIKTLYDTPPWDWPKDAGDTFLEVLGDQSAAESDRLMAAEMAGNSVVVNDRLATALLDVVRSGEESEELRGQAAIALGPALEHADLYEFEDPDDILLSEQAFHEIREALHLLYLDAGLPPKVRLRILEVAVRAPQEWQREAVRAAHDSSDENWRLTAVFCMRFIDGFDKQILEALESGNPDIRYQAVWAAGHCALDAAWPHIAGIVTAERPDKPLLLAAIDTAVAIRPQEAAGLLGGLMDSEDEDISDAVFEALAMAGGMLEADDDFEEDGDRVLH